jgi:hypothetical protein
MSETASVFDTLTRLGAERLSGVHLQPPAHGRSIRRMQDEARKELGELVPDEYIALLKVTDGVQINGAYFKSAENLVPENLDVPRVEIIVLGNAGNNSEFVFDRRDRRFHTINMGFADERFASFDTFAELLVTVVREQGVV